jgi:hypothetical protein
MDQKMLDKAQNLYELAKRAGLITSETFSTIFSKEKFKEILDGLDRDKRHFLQNIPEVKDPEKLWNMGIDLKISELVAQVLLDFLQNIHQAFSVAYDQPVEDVVFNFQSVSKDLNISDLGEKQEDGKWFQGMKIGEEIFWYKSGEGALVQDVLSDIGRKLFPLSKCILCDNFRDQDQYIVIDLDFVSEFEEFGFSPV